MKILFATWQYAPEPTGGAENQARLQADELSRRGHEVVVVCPRTTGYRSGRVGAVRVVRLPRLSRRPFQRITYFVSLALFLTRHVRQFDVVHVHIANHQADLVVAIAKLFGTPTHVKLASGGKQGELVRLRGPARLTRWFGIKHAASVQAISHEIERDLIGIGVDPRRIARIPNGIQPSPPIDDRAAVRSELRNSLGLTDDDVLVTFVGRFAVYKGIGDLIAAWEQLAEPAGRLLLVGGPALDRPFGAIPPHPSIHLYGWSKDVPRLLRASDIFVLPSHSEGMSNALLEAMSCGLPIIATDVGAAREMLDDGKAGLLIAPHAADELAEALRELIRREDERSRLGEAARREVARYDISSVVSELEAVYSRIAQRT
jgi:glycosyltransferase involved in cell wall biosynthesis